MFKHSSTEDNPMRVLITADLHLTNRPLDEYRWEFFQWLSIQEFDALLILGDLVDEKDCHPSGLVNRVVAELTGLANDEREIHILMGNHDYSLENSPFFEFLKYYPNIYYHSVPEIWEIGNRRWAFYPHSHDPEKYMDRMLHGSDAEVDVTLCHQVFDGALSERGADLNGWKVGRLTGAGKVLAGDVHVPQVLGDVEYVGAPYPIHFGDTYKPQVIIYDGRTDSWLYKHPTSIHKLVLEISNPSQIELKPGWEPGDQVKVVLKISRADFGCWETYRKQVKQICKRNDLVLCGIELKERVRSQLTPTPSKRVVGVSRAEQFQQYCQQLGVDKNDADYGKQLL